MAHDRPRSPLPPLLLVLFGACGPSSSAPTVDATPAATGAPVEAARPRAVEVRTAAFQSWGRTLRVTGELVAHESATIAAKVPGRLAELRVDVGARVEPGEVLASLETRDLELRVAQAQAALGSARARLGTAPEDDGELDAAQNASVREAEAVLLGARQERDRLRQLGAEGVVTQALLDDAQARYLAAESRWLAALDQFALHRAQLVEREVELEVARQALSDALLRAPFAGAVSARLAGTGEYLGVGAPVLRLVRFDPARVRLEVPERGAAEVRLGQTVRLRFEGGGPTLEAPIARRLPVLEARSRTLWVELDLPNPAGELLPGAFVRAEIVLDPDARTLVVPAAALVRFAGIDKVLLALEGRAQERDVVVGRTDGERAEILAGLEEGLEVVLDPGGLTTGTALEVRR